MERRRFVRLAAASAAVGATGCLGGDDGDDANEDDTPEPAEFGYTKWLPSADYRLVGYFDLAATRELTELSRDGRERTVVGDASVGYADVDAMMTTSSGSELEFEAYVGEFDTSADELLPDAETSEHAGFTVASATVDDDDVELAVSDAGIVVSRGGASATSVIDAAVGDAARQADEGEDEIIAGLSEYAQSEPLAVQFDYGSGNTMYQFFEERDDGVAFVEVAVLPDEEAARQTYEEDYNYSDGRLEELNTTAEVQGRRLIIESVVSPESVEEDTLGTGGLLP
ncbi:MAG: hypothetical protein ACLFR5_00850 [Halobacteriales archaeon]